MNSIVGMLQIKGWLEIQVEISRGPLDIGISNLRANLQEAVVLGIIRT